MRFLEFIKIFILSLPCFNIVYEFRIEFMYNNNVLNEMSNVKPEEQFGLVLLLLLLSFFYVSLQHSVAKLKF